MLPPAPLSRKAEEGGLGGQAGGVAVVGGEAPFFGGLLLAVRRRLKARLRSGKFALHRPSSHDCWISLVFMPGGRHGKLD